jgi:RimJ/RimL family protein N-acetyltransferase
MFGINMQVKHKEIVVNLRPLTKADLPILVDHFSSMKIHLNTHGLFAQTLESEEEWYNKVRDNEDSCVWAIQPANSDSPIGVTSLNNITSRSNSCTSGIIIWDTNWWGKGVATASHLARTMFAADYLNRFTIRSEVKVQNEASRKALERVGYTVWGTEPLSVFKGGVWQDTNHLIWLNPEKISVLYPDKLPEMFVTGVEKAKIALDMARKEVCFL